MKLAESGVWLGYAAMSIAYLAALELTHSDQHISRLAIMSRLFALASRSDDRRKSSSTDSYSSDHFDPDELRDGHCPFRQWDGRPIANRYARVKGVSST
jgi:hypothetical protein